MTAGHWVQQGGVPRVMIPTAIFPQQVVGATAARVYAALAIRANNRSGLVDSTVEQIATDAGISRSSAADGVSKLLKTGWIEQVRHGNSRVSNKYRMRPEPLVELSTDRPEIRTVRSVDRPEIRTVNPPENETVDKPDNKQVTKRKRPNGPSGNPDPLLSPVSDDLSIPRGRPARPGQPDATDIETIIDEMQDQTGKTITADYAKVIYRDVLDRANGVPRHPLSYVLKAIRAEPHRYQPVPVPPPYKAARQLPLVVAVPDEERHNASA